MARSLCGKKKPRTGTETADYARSAVLSTSTCLSHAWNPSTLVAMESAEQALTPSPPPLKPSKSGPGVKGKGGRLLLAACLAAYFATLAAGSQLTSRIDFWKRLGVPAT